MIVEVIAFVSMLGILSQDFHYSVCGAVAMEDTIVSPEENIGYEDPHEPAQSNCGTCDTVTVTYHEFPQPVIHRNEGSGLSWSVPPNSDIRKPIPAKSSEDPEGRDAKLNTFQPKPSDWEAIPPQSPESTPGNNTLRDLLYKLQPSGKCGFEENFPPVTNDSQGYDAKTKLSFKLSGQPTFSVYEVNTPHHEDSQEQVSEQNLSLGANPSKGGDSEAIVMHFSDSSPRIEIDKNLPLTSEETNYSLTEVNTSHQHLYAHKNTEQKLYNKNDYHEETTPQYLTDSQDTNTTRNVATEPQIFKSSDLEINKQQLFEDSWQNTEQNLPCELNTHKLSRHETITPIYAKASQENNNEPKLPLGSKPLTENGNEQIQLQFVEDSQRQVTEQDLSLGLKPLKYDFYEPTMPRYTEYELPHEETPYEVSGYEAIQPQFHEDYQVQDNEQNLPLGRKPRKYVSYEETPMQYPVKSEGHNAGQKSAFEYIFPYFDDYVAISGHFHENSRYHGEGYDAAKFKLSENYQERNSEKNLPIGPERIVYNNYGESVPQSIKNPQVDSIGQNVFFGVKKLQYGSNATTESYNQKNFEERETVDIPLEPTPNTKSDFETIKLKFPYIYQVHDSEPNFSFAPKTHTYSSYEETTPKLFQTAESRINEQTLPLPTRVHNNFDYESTARHQIKNSEWYDSDHNLHTELITYMEGGHKPRQQQLPVNSHGPDTIENIRFRPETTKYGEYGSTVSQSSKHSQDNGVPIKPKHHMYSNSERTEAYYSEMHNNDHKLSFGSESNKDSRYEERPQQITVQSQDSATQQNLHFGAKTHKYKENKGMGSQQSKNSEMYSTGKTSLLKPQQRKNSDCDSSPMQTYLIGNYMTHLQQFPGNSEGHDMKENIHLGQEKYTHDGQGTTPLQHSKNSQGRGKGQSIPVMPKQDKDLGYEVTSVQYNKNSEDYNSSHSFPCGSEIHKGSRYEESSQEFPVESRVHNIQPKVYFGAETYTYNGNEGIDCQPSTNYQVYDTEKNLPLTPKQRKDSGYDSPPVETYQFRDYITNLQQFPVKSEGQDMNDNIRFGQETYKYGGHGTTAVQHSRSSQEHGTGHAIPINTKQDNKDTGYEATALHCTNNSEEFNFNHNISSGSKTYKGGSYEESSRQQKFSLDSEGRDTKQNVYFGSETYKYSGYEGSGPKQSKKSHAYNTEKNLPLTPEHHKNNEYDSSQQLYPTDSEEHDSDKNLSFGSSYKVDVYETTHQQFPLYSQRQDTTKNLHFEPDAHKNSEYEITRTQSTKDSERHSIKNNVLNRPKQIKHDGHEATSMHIATNFELNDRDHNLPLEPKARTCGGSEGTSSHYPENQGHDIKQNSQFGQEIHKQSSYVDTPQNYYVDPQAYSTDKVTTSKKKQPKSDGGQATTTLRSKNSQKDTNAQHSSLGSEPFMGGGYNENSPLLIADSQETCAKENLPLIPKPSMADEHIENPSVVLKVSQWDNIKQEIPPGPKPCTGLTHQTGSFLANGDFQPHKPVEYLPLGLTPCSTIQSHLHGDCKGGGTEKNLPCGPIPCKSAAYETITPHFVDFQMRDGGETFFLPPEYILPYPISNLGFYAENPLPIWSIPTIEANGYNVYQFPGYEYYPQNYNPQDLPLWPLYSQFSSY